MLKPYYLAFAGTVLACVLIAHILPGCRDKGGGASLEKETRDFDRATDDPHVTPSPMGPPFVVLLGTGTPVPDPARSGPSTAIVTDRNAYIVDFGPGVVRRAVSALQNGTPQLAPQNLHMAFATHLHSDHTAGLPDLLFTPAVVGRARPLAIYGPPGLAKMAEQIEAAYAQDIAVRGNGRSQNQMKGYQIISHEVVPGPVFHDDEISVTAFSVKHGYFKYAFGYRFETAGRTIVVSGDTAPSDSVVRACNGCDVLVHEAYCAAGFARGPRSWQRYHASFHTSAVELGRLAARAKPELLVVTHLLLFGCNEEQMLREIKENFSGEAVIGKDLGVY